MAMTACAAKFCDQLDLLVGEQADLLAIDGNSANQLIPLEHWHQDERARPREFYQRGACVWLFCRDVGNVDDLLCLDEAAHIGWNCGVAPSKFFELTRSAMHRHQSKLTFLEQQQSAELGFADAGCACQHCLEHRLQLAGRARDDAQAPRRSPPAAPSLAQLALRLCEAAFEIGSGFLRHRGRPMPSRLDAEGVEILRDARKPLNGLDVPVLFDHLVGSHEKLVGRRAQGITRRSCSDCCARAAMGKTAAAPPSSVMNSRRHHSITSSASNCMELGIARPSALAVFRLMTNSNLVGCMTGRSAGLSPLRIRPV